MKIITLLALVLAACDYSPPESKVAELSPAPEPVSSITCSGAFTDPTVGGIVFDYKSVKLTDGSLQVTGQVTTKNGTSGIVEGTIPAETSSYDQLKVTWDGYQQPTDGYWTFFLDDSAKSLTLLYIDSELSNNGRIWNIDNSRCVR
jgi:hypothetical protein